MRKQLCRQWRMKSGTIANRAPPTPTRPGRDQLQPEVELPNKLIMRTLLANFFLCEPTPGSDGYRYGMLAFVIALLVSQILLSPHISSSNPGGRWSGFIVPLMLLFNHLAFQFRWSRTVAISLRVVAYLWIAFGSAYIGLMYFGKI